MRNAVNRAAAREGRKVKLNARSKVNASFEQVSPTFRLFTSSITQLELSVSRNRQFVLLTNCEARLVHSKCGFLEHHAYEKVYTRGKAFRWFTRFTQENSC